MTSSRTINVGWGLMTASAIVIGLVSLRYCLPHVPHPVLVNFITHRKSLCVHAVSASIALLTGPWQFLNRLRRGRPAMHRLLGRAYVGAVLVGWISSIPVALHAQTGTVASIGFLTLGGFWITTTLAGLLTILRRNVVAHRRWMIRSYALTAAAITLRIYLGIVGGMHWPFGVAYPVIAWLCWVPNIVITEALLDFAGFRSAAVRGLPEDRQPSRSLSSSPLKMENVT